MQADHPVNGNTEKAQSPAAASGDWPTTTKTWRGFDAVWEKLQRVETELAKDRTCNVEMTRHLQGLPLNERMTLFLDALDRSAGSKRLAENYDTQWIDWVVEEYVILVRLFKAINPDLAV